MLIRVGEKSQTPLSKLSKQILNELFIYFMDLYTSWVFRKHSQPSEMSHVTLILHTRLMNCNSIPGSQIYLYAIMQASA